MSTERPRYRLQDFHGDGSTGEPRLYDLKDAHLEWGLDRRGFLVTAAAGVGITGAFGLTLQAAAAPPAAEPAVTLIPAHAGAVKGLAFHPAGSWLVSGSMDMSIKIWEMPSAKLHKAHKGKDAIHSIAMSADGSRALYGTDDHSITARLLPEGISDRTLRTWSKTVVSLAVSPDGKLLASGADDGAVQLWDLAAGKVSKGLTGQRRAISALAWSPDGRLLASASRDGSTAVWDAAAAKRLYTFRGHGSATGSVAWSADGGRLFTGGADEMIRAWNGPDFSAGWAFNAHAVDVTALKVSPDGKLLVSGGWDGAIKIWDPGSGKLIRALSGHTGPVNCFGFQPDGRLLASGGDDRTIRLWHPGTGEFLTCLFDPADFASNRKASQYTWTNQYGQAITYTLPCGSPIPPGAVCTCNCVPGSLLVPVPRPSTGGTYCSCVPVCTCVPIK